MHITIVLKIFVDYKRAKVCKRFLSFVNRPVHSISSTCVASSVFRKLICLLDSILGNIFFYMNDIITILCTKWESQQCK